MVENQTDSPLIDIKMPGDETAVATETAVVLQEPKKPDKGGFIWGTGRRKSSVARVRIKTGSGELKINKKELNDYFARPQDKNAVIAPLKATDMQSNVDIFVSVKGGGITGQSGAVMLGIARALKNLNPELTVTLRDAGYLTRDGRMVERKKPGQPGARKKFQFSKR